MRAYSMDLRERVLHDSDAGMQAVAGREQIPRQCLLGPAAQTTAAGNRRSRPAPAALRAASGARVPAAHARGIDPRATGPHPRRPTGRPGYVRQSGDDLAGRETAGLYRKKKRYARPNTIAPTSRPPARSGRRLPRRSTRLASSFWMKAGSPPISCGAMGAAFAASGSPITRPRVGGRAVPSSPRCG